MTDRELQGLAAKAAGYTLGPEWNLCHEGIFVNGTGNGDGFVWSPLTDDGDALRLAVTLNMDISFNETDVCAFPEDGSPGSAEPRHVGDVCAAMRRAIVRAAAEIGKAQGGGHAE